MAEVNRKCILTVVILSLLFIFVPILWLIPLPFGYSIEFTVYYEDSTYFTGEYAEGIDILLDGEYYGTTDAFGMFEIRMPDKENHTMSILYNDGVIYEYLIEYGTEITQVDVSLQTKSLETEFRWNFGSNDLVTGESVEIWYNRAGTFELIGTQTTSGSGIVLFDGLIMGEYKRYKRNFYLYKFIGIDYEIPVVLIELNQSTVFKSVDLLVEPVTVMFDFDYEDSAIFGVDYPVEGLTTQLWVYQYDYYEYAPNYIVHYAWKLVGTQTTDAEGRTYFYNLETDEVYGEYTAQVSMKWFYSDEYKVTWSYDGVAYEQPIWAHVGEDFYNELACKEVQATFNWNVAGLPVANNTDVWLTFTDGTHAPLNFTTDANGQLTITGLIMGNYDLEGAVFASIQSAHTKVIPQILIEPTKGKGILKLVQNKFISNFYFFYFLFLEIITLILKSHEPLVYLDFCLLDFALYSFYILPTAQFNLFWSN